MPFIWNPPKAPPKVTAGPPNFPLDFIFNILSFILQIIGILSSPIPAIEQAVNNTWQNFMFTSAFFFNFLGAIQTFLGKLFTIILSGLAHIINDIIHGHLLQMIKD